MNNKELATKVHALRARKQQLQEMLELQEQIEELEARLLLSSQSYIVAVRIIAETVCAHYQLPMVRMTSRSRTQDDAWPRMVTCYFASTLGFGNDTAIGRIMRRNHGTIIHATRTVTNRKATEPKFAAELAALENTIRTALAGEKIEIPFEAGDRRFAVNKPKLRVLAAK